MRNFLCLPVFALFLQKYASCHVIFQIFIFKIEIKNKGTYSPEVSVSSIMDIGPPYKYNESTYTVHLTVMPKNINCIEQQLSSKNIRGENFAEVPFS